MQSAMQTEVARATAPAITQGARFGLMATLVTATLALPAPAAAQAGDENESDGVSEGEGEGEGDGESEPGGSAAGASEADDADYDEPSGCSGPFCKGSIGLSVMVGSASAGSRDYLIIGAGVSYYVIDGLSLGLDGEVWLLEDPTVYTLTPQARYVFHFVPVVKPYLGAFYRHYFLSGDFDDIDSIGARLGAYIVPGAGSYVGLGAVYETQLGCEDGAFRDCDGWYPEITLGFAL